MSEAIQSLAYVPQSTIAPEQSMTQPAGSAAAARFENLLYAPGAASGNGAPGEVVSTGWQAAQAPQAGNRLRAYADEVSALWRASARKADQLLNAPQVSYRDLLVFQRDISTTLVSVELASKTSGMVESGVQTLIQRS